MHTTAKTKLFMALALVMTMLLSQNVSGQSLTAGYDALTDNCKEKLFPVTSGGSKDEKVSCTMDFSDKNRILVAGNTTSEDYAPAASDHAFLYSIDLDGNWVYGKFFYNVSFAISTISGCSRNSEGNAVFLGTGNSVPIIMEVSPVDGQVLKFLSLEKVGTTQVLMPWYATYGAIYHDLKDPSDDKAYYYASFIMDDELILMKINTDTYEIAFVNQYKSMDTTTGMEWKNKKIPALFIQDKNDVSRMYLLGQFNQRASVIKFDKQQADVDWKLEIKSADENTNPAPKTEMSEIYSYAQSVKDNQWIYGCGYKWVDPAQETYKNAVTMKFSTDGQVQFVHVWASAKVDQRDTCRAAAYDENNDVAVFLLEVTSSTLRPSYESYKKFSSANSDLLIVRMDPGGIFKKAININYGGSSVDFIVGGHSFFITEGVYFFGSYSYGYDTTVQNKTYNIATPTYDSHLFRIDPSSSSKCFHKDEMSVQQITAQATRYDNNVVADKTQDRELLVKQNNIFKAYSSKYSGSFALLDSLRYPKMCVDFSQNLTKGVTYYRGQKEEEYQIGLQSKGSEGVNMMTDGGTWLFQNGSMANGNLGRWVKRQNDGRVYVQTDSAEAEGIQRTIIRGCSRFDKLAELYLYVKVLKNSYPDFETEIQTTWTLSVGQNFTYKLPKLVDEEQNAVPELWIMDMKDQEYPPFLAYENATRTLVFTPHSIWYQGKTYYFRIIVKETGSETQSYPYYCTVKISGNIIDPEEYLNFTDVTFDMGQIDRYGRGNFTWSHPVNLTFIQENWASMFDVYVKNITFKEHNMTMPVKEFIFTNLSDPNNGTVMWFNVTFYEPYRLGLLQKKTDKLYIHLKYDLLDVKGYFRQEYRFLDDMFPEGYNKTKTRMYHQKCLLDLEADSSSTYGSTTNREKINKNVIIPLQFDFHKNDQMQYMRTLSVRIYWYICGIVFLQFFILLWRNVGLLPVWTMIEYMQLVAFIPLYNFTLIPYLYDAFKPFLVSHMVLTNETFVLKEFEDDYFNLNYDYYWLNIAKLGQALFLIAGGFVLLIIINILFFMVYFCSNRQTRIGQWTGRMLSQFKFNAYIRYYMLAYFDLTFFSVMKLVEGNDSTQARKIATLASYVIFTFSVIIPAFLIFIVCKRFEVMKIKAAKASFNTLVLKIDKQSRWRLVQPFYFFFRRLLTAVLLSMPIDNTFIFLQYVFILMSSHAYVLYLVAIKPYQSPLFNNYVLSNETFYSALIIAIFIFSDATPELNIKFGAGVVLMTSIFLLIFANFLMIIILVYKGRDRLKEQIREAKLKRAEKELMEEEEEEERRQRQKKEEEEFTRLPEETTNMSHYEMTNTTNPALMNTQGALNPKKKSKKGKKGKGQDDNVEDFAVGVRDDDFDGKPGAGKKALDKDKKKKKKKDKNKGKQDDVQDADMEEQVENPVTTDKDKGKKTKGSTDEFTSSSDKKKQNKKKGGDDGPDGANPDQGKLF